MKALIIVLALFAALATCSRVSADGPTEAVIRDRAQAHQVSSWLLVEVARCESSLDRWAIGDSNTSFGLFQLSALKTGLLRHFYSVGYDDPFSAWQSSDYVARAFSGQFRGIEPGRWSCYWITKLEKEKDNGTIHRGL